MIEIEEKEIETVEKLCEVINEANLNIKKQLIVLVNFLYSVGASMEGIDSISNEELLKRYASNPTAGYALMTQAMYMRDSWFREEEPEEEEK